jgi:Bacteriophage abortive infection AbiH
MYYHITPKLHCTTFHIHHMNRLIIIGNGFDLAHGLKTRYSDFMLDYLKRLPSKIDYRKRYQVSDLILKDDLFELTMSNSGYYMVEPNLNNLFTVNDVRTEFSRNGIRVESPYNFISSLLMGFSTQNWVDVENEYFQKLTGLLSMNNVQELKDLNSSFELLKTKFLAYLEKLDLSTDGELFTDYLSSLSKKDGKDSNTLILNFNYTCLIDHYLKVFQNVEVINIHGDLNSQTENPIIFGYGDDHHVGYSQLEDTNIADFLINMKAMHYFKTNNYKRLLYFIQLGKLGSSLTFESEKFTVTVLGHSLGLSDRTMFKTIFEHENCKSIDLAYFGNEDDHFYKTIEASRHFSKKVEMRSKLNDINRNLKMPQFQKSNL